MKKGKFDTKNIKSGIEGLNFCQNIIFDTMVNCVFARLKCEALLKKFCTKKSLLFSVLNLCNDEVFYVFPD